MLIEYFLLIVGVVLLAIEMVVPGFGIFGISGILCLTWSGFYLMGGGVVALCVIVGFYLLLALGIVMLCVYLPCESCWNPLVLWENQGNSKDYVSYRDNLMLVGLWGVTLTVLRPAGVAMVDGRRLHVSSLGDYVPKGISVCVVKVEGNKIFVEALKEEVLSK